MALPLLPLGALLLGSAVGAEATITVVIDGIRSDEGVLRISLCTEETFGKWSACNGQIVPAQEGSVTLRYNGIAPGEYAVSLFHDADNDGEFDSDRYGRPQESTGSGTDKRPFMRGPNFSEATFTVDDNGRTVNIMMRHFGPAN